MEKKNNKISHIEKRYTSPFSNFQQKSLATVLCLMKNILGLGPGNDCTTSEIFVRSLEISGRLQIRLGLLQKS